MREIVHHPHAGYRMFQQNGIGLGRFIEESTRLIS